jgi:hypothetical protein
MRSLRVAPNRMTASAAIIVRPPAAVSVAPNDAAESAAVELAAITLVAWISPSALH